MFHTKTYAFLTSLIFAVVAVVHTVRIAASWDLVIGGWPVPIWVSVVGIIVPGFLAVEGFLVGRRSSIRDRSSRSHGRPHDV